MQYPLVSITFITHNRKEDVRETLREIKKIDYPNYEIVVVDNTSTDGVVEMIEKNFPHVRLFKLPYNKPLRARNISFQEAKGDYVVTLDDDSHPEPEAISRMVKKFEEDPCLGVIAFHVQCGDYVTTRNWRELQASMEGLFLGCGAGIRKEVFKDIGHYDEFLDGYAEEFDFTYRAYNAGYTLGHFKNIIAHHRPRFNKNRVYRFFYQNVRNQNYLIGKFISPRYWPQLYIRSVFYRLIGNYYLGGAKALLYTILGDTLGVEYMWEGYKRRIKINEEIQRYIFLNRQPEFPIYKFFLNNNWRFKILSNAKGKNSDHILCPRPIEDEETTNKRLFREHLTPREKEIYSNHVRISIASLRQDEKKRELLFQFIQSRLHAFRKNNPELPATEVALFEKQISLDKKTLPYSSIIIATYNRHNTLNKQLLRLVNQTIPPEHYEIIIVDDGSTDATKKTVDIIKQEHRGHRIKYIFQVNSGPAKARNRGIKEAKGEIVFFTDDDCLVPENWLAVLLYGYTRYPEAVGVGGWHMPPKEEIKNNLISAYQHFKSFPPNSRRAFLRQNCEIISNSPANARGVFAYNTANVSYRKYILERFGGFRENFYWPGCEDNDLALRILDAGNHLLYLPFHVVHSEALSLKKFIKKYFCRGANDYLYFVMNRKILEERTSGITEKRFSVVQPFNFDTRFLTHKLLALVELYSYLSGITYMKYHLYKSRRISTLWFIPMFLESRLNSDDIRTNISQTTDKNRRQLKGPQI